MKSIRSELVVLCDTVGSRACGRGPDLVETGDLALPVATTGSMTDDFPGRLGLRSEGLALRLGPASTGAGTRDAVVGRELVVRGTLRTPVSGPVDRMKSARSLTDSSSILASRAVATPRRMFVD